MLRFHWLLLGLVLCLFGCGEDDAGSEGDGSSRAGEPLVMTTFYPTTYFTERIGGQWVRVTCPVPEDADPIFWQPSRDDLANYQKADLIIVNGAEFEKWVSGASLPSSRIVDTAKRFEDQFVKFETTSHRHGTQGEHTHEGIDGHTWLDPVLAREQAKEIESALTRRFSRHAEPFRLAALGLYGDLEKLHKRLLKSAKDIQSVQLLASHPAYNYLAQRYDWNIQNFDLDPKAPLEPEQIEALKLAIPESGRAILLWESAPLEESAAKLKDELGLASIVYSPAELLGE
ncbi:MAG: metal ABC transporter substrate-binding protein [Planctomycetota bacterium]